ncbi:MAG: hypothetical protein O3B31_08825 [Chloroflexi bacterium]|nr:hypothetical protein [Chloroflexota bacterium]
MVNSEYPGKQLTVDDACALSGQRVRVRVFDGEVVATEPASLYLLRGGT